MEELLVIKIGGNIIDNAEALSSFLQDFATITANKILVHGGGKLATELSNRLGIATRLVDGRRITDTETIKVVTMTYAGWINKSIVAVLNCKSCTALGLTGADARLLPATKRAVGAVDYGWVGDIDKSDVNTGFLKALLAQHITPVVAPLSADNTGNLLNINADTVARTLAEAMAAHYNVSLIYCFEKNGLLKDVNDSESVIHSIDTASAEELKNTGIISQGMLPKIDNALAAINNGVKSVQLGHAQHILQLAGRQKGFGTTVIK